MKSRTLVPVGMQKALCCLFDIFHSPSKIIAFQDFCSTLAWVWNLIERVAQECVGDIHWYLFFAEWLLFIEHTLFRYLAGRAFWQLD
jgi:hypothetical protein